MEIKKIISVNELKFFGNEKKYINDCINKKWISSDGPFVKKFENNFSKIVKKKYGTAVCNGSAALEIAVQALNLKPNDEVLVPAFTIISCCNAIIKNKLKPVLVDCDLKTWNLDVNLIENLITKRTKAIMIVHIYGLTSDIDPIIKIAKKYKLKIIEDASEVHGQFYKDRPCGSFGDISTFSFYANKHITTGEGGMVLTNSKKYNERINKIKNLYFGSGINRFYHGGIGSNFRMTSFQAAFGLSQLKNLKKIISIKEKLGETYTKLLQRISKFVYLPLSKTSYCKNNYWIYGILIKKNINMDNKKAITLLEKKGIICRPFFVSMSLQPIYKKMKLFKNSNTPNANYLSRKGFYIPSGVGTKNHQMITVVKELYSLFKNIHNLNV
jgi:perosamine synthetase